MSFRVMVLVALWSVVPVLVLAQQAPAPEGPPLPDPCTLAPNLPFCE